MIYVSHSPKGEEWQMQTKGVVHKVVVGVTNLSSMEGSSGVPKSVPLSYIYLTITSCSKICFVALCRPWINIIYCGEQALCIMRHICMMELNLSSSRIAHSNLNWPLLPCLWWLDKSMAHSWHLQIQLWHGFPKITHQLMEGGFLPHAEETQGSRWKGGFWLDWSYLNGSGEIWNGMWHAM